MASPQARASNGERPGIQSKPATFYLGLGLYVFSFFLPAVESFARMPGWMCAYMALIAWPNEHLWLCLFGGIINPLILVYIFLRFRDNAPQGLRAISALSVLACVPLAWLSLSDLGAAIRVGHVFWIAGLPLILLPARTPWPTIQDVRWLAVPPLLLLIWWGLKLVTVSPLQALTERDIFIYEVALQFKEPELCQKISPYAEGKGVGGDPGREISYLQSDCYFELAGALHESSLCDKVRPISKGILDGSKYAPEWCRVSPSPPVISIVNTHTVAAWMRQLGYTDPEIYHFEYRKGLNSPIHEAYDRLRKDSQFAGRIAAAPSFDEPTATSKSRPPNDLEYLYAMFATDANDSSVCGKISPNATRQWVNHQVIPLRLECYQEPQSDTSVRRVR
jgi:hypothetical protein